MDITVNARHVEYNDEIKNFTNDAIEAAFGDFRLKINSISMILELQKNVMKASITVNIKDYPVSASAESMENIYSAITAAIDKAAAQARKYLDKKQDHKKKNGL